jgi:SagB-type dehydrogenase family enzyme
MMRAGTRTAEFASLVYGPTGVATDDPAEAFHEASRLYPNVAPARLVTLLELARSPELQLTTARSSRTHDQRPGVDLPREPLPRARFGDLVCRRRSEIDDGRQPLRSTDLATVLGASYLAVERPDAGSRRPVPSAGALYPLEVYAIALAVAGLEPCAYHYNPFRHRLESLGAVADEETRAALVDPALAERAAALIIVTAMFWRSRFKYGERGYRFALLEAGHLAQNALLAATALGLAALPVGGFYDRLVDRLVGVDGLDEATVYVLALGGRK